jgi:hypothetical protein
VAIGQTEHVGRTKFGIASATGPRDLQKFERDQFPNSRRHQMPIYSIVFEIVVGDGQPAVIFAAMLSKLDLDAFEHPAGR